MSGVTISNELRAHLSDMATACRVLSMEGHEDGTQGHLSLRDPEGRGLWLKRMGVPLGRIGSAEEVAEAGCMLISPASRYVSGEMVIVNGATAFG